MSEPANVARSIEVREQGWRARERGECRESNPFARASGRESQEFGWWDCGWVMADEDIELDRQYQWDEENL
jgi:hypothetical protein